MIVNNQIPKSIMTVRICDTAGLLILNPSKYYGRSREIVGLDFSVGENDFFGFIGLNGSGKSTTIRTLLGLISKTHGNTEVFGKNITSAHAEIL